MSRVTRSYRRMFIGLFLLVFIIGSTQITLAADETVDSTWGGTGKVETDLSGAQSDQIADLLVQPDGKVLAIGSWRDVPTQFAVVRYLSANGALDTSFDGDGKALVPLFPNGPSQDDTAQAAALQADGKMVIVGTTYPNPGGRVQVGVVRLNPNGSLDTSFDGDGYVQINATQVELGITGNSSYAHDVAVQADGKLVIAAGIENSNRNNTFSNSDVAVIRLNPNGSLDSSFGGNGIVSYFLETAGFNNANALTIQPDGRIVVAGDASRNIATTYETDILVLRLLPTNGAFDPAFNGGNPVTIDAAQLEVGFAESFENVVGVEIQGDGRVVIGGSTSVDASFNSNVMAVRLNPNGALDSAYAGNGVVLSDINGGDDGISDLALQADEKLVMVGSADQSASLGANDSLIVRYTTAGALDTTWNGTGKLTIDNGPSSGESAQSAAIQQNGRIVSSMSSGASGAGDTRNFFTMRFNGAPAFNYTGLTPAHLSTGASVTTNLVLTFGQPMSIGTGDIEIRRISDNALFESIPVTDPRVSGGGTATISVNPTGTLAALTPYYVIVDRGAFTAGTAGSFSGVTLPSEWHFTTGSATSPPQVDSFNAPSVTQANAGQTSYSFTVQYSDDTAIDVASIGASDVTVTGPAGAVTVVSGSATGGNGTPRTATYTITPPGGAWNDLDNGTYTISLRANEVADTGGAFAPAGTIGSFTVSMDTTAPAAPVFTGISNDTGASPSDEVTNDNTLFLNGSAEPNSVVTVTRVGTGVLGTAAVSAGGTWSYDYTGTALADGSHTFSATARDAANNTGATSTSFVVTVDTVAPAAPTVTGISNDTGASASDGVTNDPTLLINGTVATPGAVTVTRAGSGVLGTVSSSGTTWSYDYTGTTLADGSYTFSATTVDLAGNTSPASNSFVVTVDRAPPAAPVLTGISNDTGASASDEVTSDTTLFLNGSAEPNSVVTVTRVGTGVLGTAAVSAGGTWSYDDTATTLADGNYTFTATTVDLAGNTSPTSSSFVVTIDTVAPAAPVVTGISNDTGASANDGVTSDPTLMINGTVAEPGPITVTRSGAGVLGTVSSSGTTWSYDDTATTLADGSYTFSATTVDLAGNTSAPSANFSVIIDTLAPVAPVITGISNDTGTSASDGVTNDPTLLINGTVAAPGPITVTRTGSGVLGSVAATGATWSYDYTGTSLPDGSYSFSATTADLAGNVSAASTTFTVRVDTGAPTITINQMPSQPDPTNTAPVWFVVVHSELVADVTTGDINLSASTAPGPLSAIVSSGSPTQTVAVSGMSGDGLVIATVPAGATQDLAGNLSAASTSTDNSVRYDASIPTVSSITRGAASPTNASSVSFAVTFSELVRNVDAADFQLATTGPLAGATIAAVTGGGTTWQVTVSTGSGSGTLRLDLLDDDSIIDQAANPLGGQGAGNGSFTGGEVYTIDRIAPTVTIEPVMPSPRTPPVDAMTITFSEPVAGLDLSDLTLTHLGNAVAITGQATLTTSDNQVWTLGNLTELTRASGRYELSLAATGSAIQDPAGNMLSANATTSFIVLYQTYVPIMLRPGVPDLVTSIRLIPNKTNFRAGEPVKVEVTVTNQGAGRAEGFWVDFFINPSSPPTAANQIWSDYCQLSPCFGMAWEVAGGLNAGQSIVLSSETLDPAYSSWLGWFAAGTTDLYAYADSWNPTSSLGAVGETSETNNRAEVHGLTVTGPNPAISPDVDLRPSPRPIQQ